MSGAVEGTEQSSYVRQERSIRGCGWLKGGCAVANRCRKGILYGEHALCHGKTCIQGIKLEYVGVGVGGAYDLLVFG